MKKDLKSVIKNVAKFLEKDLTDDDIEKLSKHLTFQNMKNMTSLEITKGCTDDDPGKANLKFFPKRGRRRPQERHVTRNFERVRQMDRGTRIGN